MPDHEDDLRDETLDGSEIEEAPTETEEAPAETEEAPTETEVDAVRDDLSLSDGVTRSDAGIDSLGDQYTFDDVNVENDLFDDDMELVDLSTRYSEEGVLGKGGFGEVVLATDNRLNRKIAIKRIQGKAARSKKAVKRFLTEAKSIAVLNHTNIVQIYDYGRATDGPFLIMECVQGGSLLDRCRKGPIELDEAVNIFSQICDGLAKAHAENIIHRDIKPANILMTEEGVPKLTDFGLAKDDTADTDVTIEGVVIGTPDYMPPEQRKGAEFTDHRSDLWSLAATFFEMLTGKNPKVLNISLIPFKLQSVIAKALEEAKEDRFQSVHEMREEVLNAHAGKIDTSRSLGEGECPQCATLNPFHGKFCVECSEILQVQCLNCQLEIQIWNKACGDCGARQTPLVDKALLKLKKVHNQAEMLLVDLDFEAAAEKSKVVKNEPDSRLQYYATWYEEFSARLELSKASEHTRLEELLREATTHELAYDYNAGLRTLLQISPSLVDTSIKGTDTAMEVHERLMAKQSRLKQLNGLVQKRVSNGGFTGLLGIVNELLRLKPDRPEVQKIKTKLETLDAELLETRDAAIKQAPQLLRNQEYAQAIRTLNAVSEEVVNEQIEKLKTTANGLLKQLNNLRDRITTAVNAGQLNGLLPFVEECLNLKADQDDLVKLRKKLIDREKRKKARKQQIATQAKQLMQQSKFDEAGQLLDKTRQEYRTSAIVGIRQQVQSLSLKRQDIMSVVSSNLAPRNYDEAIKKIEFYLSEIDIAGIQDVELQEMLKDIEAKFNRKKRLVNFRIAGICGVVISLMGVTFGSSDLAWLLLVLSGGVVAALIAYERTI
ncbi:MAG: protein kinase [Planctomycetaceae bacterium]|nr:protein kinase [Planctomycetaceae bacterium]